MQLRKRRPDESTRITLTRSGAQWSKEGNQGDPFIGLFLRLIGRRVQTIAQLRARLERGPAANEDLSRFDHIIRWEGRRWRGVYAYVLSQFEDYQMFAWQSDCIRVLDASDE